MKISKQLIAGICAAGIILIVISSLVLPQQKTAIRNTVTSVESGDELNDVGEIILDAAGIPKSSKINIISNTANMNLQYDISETNGFEHFYGEKIIIRYRYPVDELNGYDLISYTNPKLTASLDGNTLNINLNYDKNIKVIFVPAWSFMWQFDQFKGKNIFKENLGISSASGGGYVFISIE